MSDRLGIGILSFAHGHISTYAREILTYDDAELVACWDDDPERGQERADGFGIPYERDLETILSRQDVDCFVVGSETNKHADLSIAAMEAGKAVLLQKPMAITLADCDRIIEAADRTGVWFSLAFQMRCDPQNIRMKEMVDSGAIGRVGFVRRRHCIPVLFNKGFVEGKTRWHITAEANKGMFFDDATHALDWMYWAFGRPASVVAEIDNVLTSIAPDDTGSAIFRYPDGKFVTITNTSVCWAGENTTEIYGDKGVIIQNHGDAPSAAVKPEHPVALKLYQADEADKGWQDLGMAAPAGQGVRIAGVTRPFIDALKANVPMCTAREGRESIEYVLACYESARSGNRITFPYSE